MIKFIGIYFILIISSLPIEGVTAQTVCYSSINNGDTLIFKNLPAINIVGKRIFRSKSQRKKYQRLERDVKIVYPYSKLAGNLLASYEDILSYTILKKDRRIIFKKIESELILVYGDNIKSLNRRQGRILIKLIDRETSKSSYNILSEFRGDIAAFMWQSISRIFGHNLKEEYNPEQGDDKIIEGIIVTI